MKNRFLPALSVAVLLLASPGSAQTPAASDPAAANPGPKMMMNMDAADRKLARLVAEMNAARGNDRIDKMAAVINELVAAHTQVRSMIMAGRGGMMQGKSGIGMPGSTPCGAPDATHDGHAHPDGK
jgi:hypothetical protein